MLGIGRREFIVALGGAAAAWPIAARAQQTGKVWRIGFLSAQPRAGSGSGLYAGFQQGMRELGYVEGQDFVGEWRSADGKYERLPELAAELVRLKMDVLISGLTPGVRALQQATSTIPIVIAYSIDPVATSSLPAWRILAGTSQGWPVHPMTPLRNNWSCWRQLSPTRPALLSLGIRTLRRIRPCVSV